MLPVWLPPLRSQEGLDFTEPYRHLLLPRVDSRGVGVRGYGKNFIAAIALMAFPSSGWFSRGGLEVQRGRPVVNKALKLTVMGGLARVLYSGCYLD